MAATPNLPARAMMAGGSNDRIHAFKDGHMWFVRVPPGRRVCDVMVLLKNQIGVADELG
jgi:hypothetical protein